MIRVTILLFALTGCATDPVEFNRGDSAPTPYGATKLCKEYPLECRK